MAKFIKVANKKLMIKVNIPEGGAKWATCPKAVKDFAEKAFKEGEEVEYQFEATGELGFHITRITKVGQGGATASVQTSTKPTCEDCGKELKDDKYKKCYTCNQKKTTSETSNAPKCKDCGKELKDAKYEKCYECNKKNPSKGGSYGKSPEVQESIKRQAIGHMTSRTLIALQGQVEVNNILGIMDTIYKKYQELVG